MSLVGCYSSDMIHIYKSLKSHYLTFSSKDLAELPNQLQPMLLVPKPKFKKCEQVWFLKSHARKNPLRKTVELLVEGTMDSNTKGRTFTNKNLQHTGITRMKERMVLVEKGMMITRHRDNESYAKYNVCILDLEHWAYQDLILGHLVNY